MNLRMDLSNMIGCIIKFRDSNVYTIIVMGPYYSGSKRIDMIAQAMVVYSGGDPIRHTDRPMILISDTIIE